MGVIKKILYFISGVLALLVGFVLVCAFRPDIAEALAKFISSEQRKTVVTEISNMPEADTSFYIKQGDEEPEASDFILEWTENFETVNDEEGNEGLGEDVTAEYIPPSLAQIIIPENVAGRNV